MQVIDLRSDTVTKPTAAMREAIARAEVGDDVFGEDPSVNRLEELAAEHIGMEAALFVPSGTMANQIAIGLHTQPGDVVLAGRNSHILLFEGGGAAALSGVQIQAIGRDGLFDDSDVFAAAAVDDIHHAPTTLVSLENTHNMGGGRVWPLDRLQCVIDAAHGRDMAVHMDGARIFNASIASGISPSELTARCDSVAFCLSKGLGAPVGSMICGTTAFVARAKRARKRLGGGMRQAGFLAAAGIHALEHHVERLAKDHENAVRFAKGLADLGIEVETTPQTNIVMFRTDGAAELEEAMAKRGVLLSHMTSSRMRAVTHLEIGSEMIDEALRRIGELLQSRPG